MYFYYFLGWELEARDDLSRAQKDARAENTYCLALGKKFNLTILFKFHYELKSIFGDKSSQYLNLYLRWGR